MRDLNALPKANLHLHLTGSMRQETAAELAARAGLELPAPLDGTQAVGWSAFQTRYDAARAALRSADDIARVVREAIADSAADGAGWLELQVDPTTYAEHLGGLEAVVETVLGAAAGTPTGIVVAASWGASPTTAQRLARLAARYAGTGVVGFGLSNDERLGRVADFAPAFRVAAGAGLLAVPHAGFYQAAWHVRDCVRLLRATRIGHGLTAALDPGVLESMARRAVAVEVCPTSYPPLGVAELAALPIREFLAAGIPVALGSDDPLLFGAGLTDQYALLREHLRSDDQELAALARASIQVSAAPQEIKDALLAGVEAWLTSEPTSSVG
ncbi:MAG TPA: adenosine deaminase [Actinopolymorphaceae bacterium]